MKKFEVLEHTADLKIKAFGGTKEELFLNSLLAMEKNMKPETKNEKAEREIKINSLDLPTLLVDFLNQVLYLNQVHKEVYFKIKFSEFTDKKIEGKFFGKKVESFGEDIKAVTHHDLDIHQTEDGSWETTILFDI